MILYNFAMMQLLTEPLARGLVDEINATTDSRMLGTWDAATGFSVRVYLIKGKPVEWFIRGPLTLGQAKEELIGPVPASSAIN